MNFDTNIHRQEAPFSGAVVGEQAIKIQSSIALFFNFSFDFLLHLLTLFILKNKKINLI
jgi:hypothetical protein